MMSLLVRLFIKDKEDATNPRVKKAYAALSSVTGILLNVFLCVIKIAMGIYSHSVAVLADGLNNLSDAGVNLVSFLGFKVAGYGGGKIHPFGHGRIEWIMGIFTSLAVSSMGIKLAETSVSGIINPRKPEFSVAFMIALALSVLIKVYMYFYNKRFAKMTDSETLKAVAADCISDSVATASVFIATLLSRITHFELDGYCGVLVSVFIIFAGVKSLWEVLGRIMGKAADGDTKKVILKMVEAYPEIAAVHHLMLHDYGFGYFVVSMCAEGYRRDGGKLYTAVQQISCELYSRFHCDCFIQIDYLLEDEEITHTVTELIDSVLQQYGGDIKTDHFRLIENGDDVNIAFRMVYPAEMQKKEEKICEDITEKIALLNPQYHTMIKGMICRERFSLYRK